MKRSITILVAATLIGLIGSRGAGQSATGGFPGGFKDEAYRHIVAITGFGTRSAGSDAEVNTAQYIIEKFAESGIEFSFEPFMFDSFDLERCKFLVGPEKYDPLTVCFDPYGGQFHFEGSMTCIGADTDIDGLDPFDACRTTVVISERVDAFAVMKRLPGLIIIVRDSDYDLIVSRQAREFVLDISGAERQYGSMNVTGTLASGNRKQIMVGAHIDSYDNLGADDNASGIAVMLELAKYFKQIETELEYSIKFVAFGAEELGIVGSRAYMNRHRDEMEDVILFINLDTVGGSRICIEGKSPEGLAGEPIHAAVSGRIYTAAWEGHDRRWRILTPQIAPFFEPAFYPDWLRSDIERSVEELELEVAVTGPLGGDQMVFEHAGIPSTSIAAFGNPIHTDDDTIDNIDRDSLERVGRLAAALIHRIIHRRDHQDHR